MTIVLAILAAAFPMSDLRIGNLERDFGEAAKRLSDILGRIYGTMVPTGAVGNVRFEKTDWADDQRYEIRTTGEDGDRIGGERVGCAFWMQRPEFIKSGLAECGGLQHYA